MEIRDHDLLIGGERRAATGTLSVENPATGEAVGRVASADAADAADAVDAAAEATAAWERTAPDERAAPLRTVADRIDDAADSLAALLAAETGKPVDAAASEVAEAATQCRFYAGVTDKMRGDTIPTASHRFNYTSRSPYGVTAHVVPWNYPLLLGTRGFAAALATGNTLVIKPPSRAPLATMRVGELMAEACPEGVVNLVTGPGSEVGTALADSGEVDAITFTGSTDVGRSVLAAAADHVTPVDVELGGKAPAIVLEDADVENAARGVVAGIFANAGQNCVATSRCLVHEAVHDELVEAVVEKTERITLGPGTDPETDVGPVVSAAAKADVLDAVETAEAAGATLLTGGGTPDDPALADGHFVEPTVFDDVTPEMAIAREEIFGPVLGVVTVPSAAEAIRIANDSPYALAAALWTESVDAPRLADRLDHGLVAVNTFPVSMPQSPWGGNGESGIGREGGLEGVEAFTTVDSVVIEHDEIEDPYL